MSRSSDASSPVYFMVTGFPKSGNKWYQKMVFDFDEVGGFHRRPERGTPLLGHPTVESWRTVLAVRRAGVRFDDFMQRIVNPGAVVPWKFAPGGRGAMARVTERLSTAASLLAKQPIPAERFDYLLSPEPAPELVRGAPAAFGLPGMHTPIRVVQGRMPSFVVLNLVRDPRDVLVSFFYHVMATMHPRDVGDFVQRGRNGKVIRREDWKRRFTHRFMRWRGRYFGSRPLDHTVHTVRYEDLLDDPVPAVRGALAALGCSPSTERIEATVAKYTFEAMTGGTGEQRNKMARKGRSGDWRNYLDREIIDTLGPKFASHLVDMGYEPDDAWLADVPETAPRMFEFSRFRIKRSTTRSFIGLWKRSPELQDRFPHPWDFDDDSDSFYGWLTRCDDRRVRDWLELAHGLETLWQVDIVEHGRS